MDKSNNDNPSRAPVKEPKKIDFAERLASLSQEQLRQLKKLIDTELKDRDGKSSLIGQLSDKEFSDLKDDLISKSEKQKKKDSA